MIHDHDQCHHCQQHISQATSVQPYRQILLRNKSTSLNKAPRSVFPDVDVTSSLRWVRVLRYFTHPHFDNLLGPTITCWVQ